MSSGAKYSIYSLEYDKRPKKHLRPPYSAVFDSGAGDLRLL